MNDDLMQLHRIMFKMYLDSLDEDRAQILNTFPIKHVKERILLLVSRRASDGELDIYCGHYLGRAVFFSLCPSQQIMLLDQKTVLERIDNMRRQGLPYDQSEEALAKWPS